MSFIVENVQTSDASFCRVLRHVPHAYIVPPLSTRLFICSVTLKVAVSMFSASTPFPDRKTFTLSPSYNAKFAYRKAFQTVSGSFE